jgi:hypothetical protein
VVVVDVDVVLFVGVVYFKFAFDCHINVVKRNIDYLIINSYDTFISKMTTG